MDGKDSEFCPFTNILYLKYEGSYNNDMIGLLPEQSCVSRHQ